MRKVVYTLGAVMLAGMLTCPVPGHAGEKQDIQTVSISAEELSDLVTGGKYLYSATDGIETGEAEAELITGQLELVGGFQKAKSPNLTKARKKIFKKAFKKYVGSEVTPVAYLASQVVAGTNHLYLCRIKAVVPDATEYYCIVSIYEDLKGKVSINEIVDTNVETNINELPGGWFQSSKPKVTKSIKKAFNKAMNNLDGVSYTPLAVLSEQVVAGMNYCILCESQVVYPGAPVNYSLVYIYKGLDGSAEITDIIPLTDNTSDDVIEVNPVEPEYSLNTVIVSVSEDASKKQLKKIFKKLGLSILYDYDGLNMYAVSLAEDTDAEGITELIEKLEAYDEILMAERDYIYHLDD